MDCWPVVGGKKRGGAILKTVTSPHDCRQILGTVHSANPEDIDAAASLAVRAGREWSQSAPEQRSRCLLRISALIRDRADLLTDLLVRECGKPCKEAAAEVERGAQIFSFYAGEVKQPTGQIIPPETRDTLIYLEYEPVGLSALIVPWNFPIAIASWKLAPALAYGNSVLFKPSELASLTGAVLFQVLLDAGVPEDVIAFLPGGPEVGSAVVEDPRVQAVSFTGSTAVGKWVLETCTARSKKVQCEMGGKNAALVMADASLEEAASLVAHSAYDFAGQKCTAASRAIVARSIVKDFSEAVASLAMGGLPTGNPSSESTVVGPLISASARERAEAVVQDSKDRGDAWTVRPERLDGGFEHGHYLTPGVVTPKDRGPVYTQELFAPILSVVPFDSVDEGVDLVNDTPYGLCAGIFTNDLGYALGLARRLDAGLVKINDTLPGAVVQAPFGGWKESGTSFNEMGTTARLFYTRPKTTYVRWRMPASGGRS